MAWSTKSNKCVDLFSTVTAVHPSVGQARKWWDTAQREMDPHSILNEGKARPVMGLPEGPVKEVFRAIGHAWDGFWDWVNNWENIWGQKPGQLVKQYVPWN